MSYHFITLMNDLMLVHIKIIYENIGNNINKFINGEKVTKMIEFSNQLKKYRTNSNITQDELANKLFVTRQAISKWESGESTPDMNNLVKLTDIFNISLDTLVLGKKENSKIDPEEFTFDPINNKYIRKYGKMNFWDFLSKNTWVIVLFAGVLAWGAMFLHRG